MTHRILHPFAPRKNNVQIYNTRKLTSAAARTTKKKKYIFTVSAHRAIIVLVYDNRIMSDVSKDKIKKKISCSDR